MSGRRSSSSLHDAVQLVVRVGQACQVALVDDRGRKARLGEDHHAGRRLDKMRTGARTDDEKERVLDFSVQPDDSGQAAEHLALPALPQHEGFARALRVRRCTRSDERVHRTGSAKPTSAGALRRAARSLSRNCVAFTT